MDGSGHQLFSRAAVSLDEDTCIRWGYILDELEDGLHFVVLGNNAAKFRRAASLVSSHYHIGYLNVHSKKLKYCARLIPARQFRCHFERSEKS